jgi:integrase
MHRRLGRASSQAFGINKDLLDRMIAVTTDDLRGIRDKALLSLAYDTLCRRSEIVSLDVTDVIYTDDQIKIRLKKSKTDQDWLGKTLEITKRTEEHLLKWLQKSKLNTGRLFRGVKNNGLLTGTLNKAQINKIYKKLAKKIHINHQILKKISGHSTRVGATQDLMSSGASLPTIMNRGRWSKTDTAMRYIENIHR